MSNEPKLSERLRALRDEHAPKDGRIFLHEALTDCIALAEAREPNVMTDEEVERLALEKFTDMVDGRRVYSNDPGSREWEAFKDGLRYARDNNYLTPPDRSRMVDGMITDEAMIVIDNATDGDLKRNDPDLWADLRKEFDFFLSVKRESAKK